MPARPATVRPVLLAQGAYYLATGVWPLVSLWTFEAVTGPKTDHWLVRTVGVLAAVIGVGLLVGVRRRRPGLETLTLGLASALGFAGVDVVYVLTGTIGPLYLADAAVQLVLVTLLVRAIPSRRPVGRAVAPF